MFHPSSEGLAKGRKESRLFRFRGGPASLSDPTEESRASRWAACSRADRLLLLITEAEIGVIQDIPCSTARENTASGTSSTPVYFRNHLRQHLKISRQPVQQFRLPVSFSSGVIRNPFGSVIDSIRRDTLMPSGQGQSLQLFVILLKASPTSSPFPHRPSPDPTIPPGPCH